MELIDPNNLKRVLDADALNQRFRSHLRLVQPHDATLICELRADPTLNAHLSSTSPDVEAQRQWLISYKEREVQGKEFYFVICCDGQEVGVVRLYDLRELEGKRSFSWGSWIIRPPRASGIVTFSAVMMYELGFDTLGFDRAHFEVIKENTGVIAFHARAGAVLERELQDRLEFGFWPETWHRFREASCSQIAAHRKSLGAACNNV